MYYSDLVAAAKKDITYRNFCYLVDVAVMLYEKRRRRRKLQEDLPSFLLDLNTISADSENPQNPNVAASCSSSSFLEDFKIAAKYAKMKNPRSPNSQSTLSSEKKSRKRRTAQDNKHGGFKSKKAKLDDTYSWIGRETSESLIHLMRDTNETMIKCGNINRKLFKTDVTPGESRLCDEERFREWKLERRRNR